MCQGQSLDGRRSAGPAAHVPAPAVGAFVDTELHTRLLSTLVRSGEGFMPAGVADLGNAVFSPVRGGQRDGSVLRSTTGHTHSLPGVCFF